MCEFLLFQFADLISSNSNQASKNNNSKQQVYKGIDINLNLRTTTTTGNRSKNKNDTVEQQPLSASDTGRHAGDDKRRRLPYARISKPKLE